jgi:hypothetical protein
MPILLFSISKKPTLRKGGSQMFINVFNFKIKSGVTEKELISLHDDIAAPIYSKTSGCKGTYILKYTGLGDEKPEWAPEWDYSAIEVWESKEAKVKAMKDANSFIDQLGQKGFFDKFWSMVEKSSASHAFPLASFTSK